VGIERHLFCFWGLYLFQQKLVGDHYRNNFLTFCCIRSLYLSKLKIKYSGLAFAKIKQISFTWLPPTEAKKVCFYDSDRKIA
jgi:hypothetical protein